MERLNSRILRIVNNILVKILPRNVKDFIKKFVTFDDLNPICPYGASLISKERLQFLLFLLQNQIYKNLEGDVIECGVYRGGTTIQMGLKLKDLESDKIVHAIDTFEGHPSSSEEDIAEGGILHYKGRYSKNNYEKVREAIKKEGADNIILYKGKCEDILPSLKNKRFCFAHLDMDIYLSTKNALEFLKDRMVENGIIMIDDFGQDSTIGVTKAANEFLGKENIIRTGQKGGYWINNTK